MKNGEKILLSYLIYFSSITEIRRRKTSEALKAEMTTQTVSDHCSTLNEMKNKEEYTFS